MCIVERRHHSMLGIQRLWRTRQRHDDGSPVPITVSGITNAIAIALVKEHTCALLSGGSVQCWGDNSFGQLGNGKHQHMFLR